MTFIYIVQEHIINYLITPLKCGIFMADVFNEWKLHLGQGLHLKRDARRELSWILFQVNGW